MGFGGKSWCLAAALSIAAGCGSGNGEPSIRELEENFKMKYFEGTGSPVTSADIRRTGAGHYSIRYSHRVCPNCGRCVNWADQPCPNHRLVERSGTASASLDINGDVHFFIN